jgi:hypothetical protein
MKKNKSLRVTSAVNDLYAAMARKAAQRAVSESGDGAFGNAINAAEHAELFAERAGGNALRWGLGV